MRPRRSQRARGRCAMCSSTKARRISRFSTMRAPSFACRAGAALGGGQPAVGRLISRSRAHAASGAGAATCARRASSCSWSPRRPPIPEFDVDLVPVAIFWGRAPHKEVSCVAAAVRRRLGAGGALPQVSQRARQRPQHRGVFRRTAAAARCHAGRHERAAQRAAAAAHPARGAARAACLDHRSRSVAPPHPGRARPEDAGGAPRRARAKCRRAESSRRAALLDGAQACDRNRGELFAALRHVHGAAAGRLWNSPVRRRGIRARREIERNRRRRRDHLRALPSQPHGLSAALVRDLPQGIRGSARRRRRESQHAGDRALPAQGRRILPAAHLQGRSAVRGGVRANISAS